jgi:hypothetical protein
MDMNTLTLQDYAATVAGAAEHCVEQWIFNTGGIWEDEEGAENSKNDLWVQLHEIQNDAMTNPACGSEEKAVEVLHLSGNSNAYLEDPGASLNYEDGWEETIKSMASAAWAKDVMDAIRADILRRGLRVPV